MSMARKRGMSEAPPAPVIVRKARRRKDHHGGAWKVAYADFVTTLMAVFIVLWAAGQDTAVREAIAAYFRNPSIVPKAATASGVLPASTGVVASAEAGGSERSPGRDEARLLEETADTIRSEIEKAPDLRPLLDQVQITVTDEGLRIQIVERDESLFFEIGSAEVKPALTRLLSIIGAAVGKIPNPVILEGHTDSRQYTQHRRGYSNWELSADRANSARRILELDGLRPGQVVRVVGFADHELFVPGNPLDTQNRRVSIVVKPQPGKAGEVGRAASVKDLDRIVANARAAAGPGHRP